VHCLTDKKLHKHVYETDLHSFRSRLQYIIIAYWTHCRRHTL